MNELREALKRLLECAELNQDDIEPDTLVTIDLAHEALDRTSPSRSAKTKILG